MKEHETEPPPEWRAYQQFRAELIEETRRAGLTPIQVALYLEARRDEFPRYIEAYEIAAYRKSPDDWKGVHMPRRWA